MAFSEREKQLGLITAVVAVVGVIYFGWHLLTAETANSEVSSATAERFEELFVKMNNVDAQKNRNLLLRKKIGSMEGTFGGQKEVSNLIAEIEKVAGSSGVQIKNWSPNINTRSKPLASLEVKITLQCRFEQLITFLNNLRTAKYLFQPTAIKASLKDKNKPELDVAMTVVSYLIESKPAKVIPTQVVVRNPS